MKGSEQMRLRGGGEWPATKTHSFNIKTGEWSVIEDQAEEESSDTNENAEAGNALVKSDGVMTADQCMNAAEEAMTEGDWDEAVSLLRPLLTWRISVAMEEKMEELGKDSVECVEVYLKFATACLAWHNHTSRNDTASPLKAMDKDDSANDDEKDSAEEDDDGDKGMSSEDAGGLGDMYNPLSCAWRVLKRAEKILDLELQSVDKQKQFRLPQPDPPPGPGGQPAPQLEPGGAPHVQPPPPSAAERKHILMLADIKEELGALALRQEATAWLPDFWLADRKFLARECFRRAEELRRLCGKK